MIDLPAPCLIHNALLGFKGTEGTLLQISETGYYLVTCKFGDKPHRVMLPIQQTAVIVEEPEAVIVDAVEIEK